MGTKISELVAGSPAAVLTGAEGVEMTQSGDSVGAIVSQLRDYIDSSIAERTGVEFTVPTLSSLKALTTRPAVVTVKTGQAAGQWQWEAASSTTADDALVVNPTSGDAGRYKRIFSGAVFPGWYGTEQGSLTNGAAADATAQVLAACQSGYPVDCRNLWWGITGSMRPLSNFYGILENFKFKQLAPTTSNCRTVFIDSWPGAIIRNGVIDCGGDQDAGDMSNHAGLWIGSSDGAQAIDIEVYNGGPICGIRFNSVADGRIVRPYVHDFVYNKSPDPSDDVIQGIFINACTDLQVIAPKVHDMTGFLLSVASLRYTRGIAVAGSTRVNISSPNIYNCDQGIDLTGSATNTEIHISNVTIGETGTYGVKFSNVHQQCSITGGTISDAGLAGVVVAGQSSATPLAIDCQISNLTIKDTGSSGLWAASFPTGVYVIASVGDNTYPRGVRVRNVDVIDTQGSPTTIYGYRSDSTPQDNFIDETCRSRNCTNHYSGFRILTRGFLVVVARGVNFNSANSDTLIPIDLPQPFTEYAILRAAISNASQTLTTATCSLWTGAGGTGTAIVASGTAITVATASDNTNNNTQTLTIVNATTNAWKHTTLYFRVQTAQGAAATADVTIEFEPRS